MNLLKDKVAVITGAGSGMGKAMTQLFAAEGARVLATDIREDRLVNLLEDLSKGAAVATRVTDVSDEPEAGAMIEHAVKKFGRIDVLVNNAGVLDDFMPAADTSTELWNRVMRINLYGPFFACRTALQHMTAQNSGVIINIASVGGFCGSRAGAAYTASKHALIGLTRNIGFMYARKGIRCNAIAPGGVTTNIAEGMHPNALGYESLSLGLQASPRTGSPQEIAEVALFLASEKASFINGSVVTADGGWTAY